MLKKCLIGAGAASLAGLLFFATDVHSYVGTSVGWVKDSVKRSVPIEFELERARHAIKDIVPAIRENMHIIAKEEVELNKLDEQIAQSETRLTKDKADLARLNDDLKTEQAHFYYASRRYSRDQVKTDLSNRFERCRTLESTLASLRQIRDARQNGLEQAKTQLETMLQQKHQLLAEVENLEARYKTLQVAKANSEFAFDDSELGRVKELISEIRQRLDVDEKLLNTEGYYQDEIQLEAPAATDENVIDEVTLYLNGGAVAEDSATVANANESPNL